MKEKFLNIQTIILSYLTFLVSWTIWTCCNNIISINEYVNWAIGVVIYFIWWLLFAVFFIKKYNNNLMIPFKEMIYTKPKIKILLPLLVFAHYPSWIFHGYGAVTILSISIMLYVLSLIFGWTFIKSRSIWTSTIYHSFWDFISFII